LFRQPSGSDEGAGAITLRSSQKAAQDGLDPIASGLPQMVVRGRPFLSEYPDSIRSRYYKGGLSEKRNPPLNCAMLGIPGSMLRTALE
jgi:hypothetical protein